MNEFWSTVVNIIVFIVSLGLLVMIHEFGHYLTAKAFNVYCHEFSIGFGPVLFKKKGKETQFSIRALPLGGYVSMAGEDNGEEQKSGEETVVEQALPVERTIAGIAKWKRFIVFGAGITLNFILGFILIWCNFAFCPQNNVDVNRVTIVAGSKLEIAGLKTGAVITEVSQVYTINNIKYDLANQKVENYVDLSNALQSYKLTEDEKNFVYKYLPVTANDTRTVTFVVKDNNPVSITCKAIENNGKNKDELPYLWETVGVSPIKEKVAFGSSFVLAGETWAYYCSAIFVAIGQLFVGKGFADLGGPLAVFKVSSQAASYGIGTFLNLWGMISINLAIFNLLPFPGLDGWSMAVTTFEAITRKEVNKKFKQIVSLIGMILLFGLMIAVTIKDIFF